MLNFVIAQIIGGIALVILIISFYKDTKTQLLKYQIFSSLLYIVQYIFLGAYTVCLMSLICIIRNYIFKHYDKNKVPMYWLIFIIILMIILSMFTFNGFMSLIPMFESILYSVALWDGNLKVIRLAEIISCLLYIIYNIYVRAYIGLIGTIIVFYNFNIKKILLLNDNLKILILKIRLMPNFLVYLYYDIKC